jgi:hypothetical protein
MDQRELAPSSDIIWQMANLLLQKRSQAQANSPATISELWVHNLVKRHKALKSRYNHKYDYNRAKCEALALIWQWFKLVQNTIMKYGILPSDTSV